MATNTRRGSASSSTSRICIAPLRSLERKADREGRADPRHGLDVDDTSECVHRSLHDIQAQTKASKVTNRDTAFERLEDARSRFGFDPHPMIRNHQARPSGARTDRDLDRLAES